MEIDPDTVRKVLEINNIDRIDSNTIIRTISGKIINQYDLEGNYIQSFVSARNAAETLGKITSTSNGASSHITDVCRGKRKTAYGYIWKFAN